jgi:hypothetical protein
VQSAQQVANAKIVLVRKRVVTAPVPSSISGVTSRNKCDVLKMTVTKGRKAANSTASCRVTLAVTNFCFRPEADTSSHIHHNNMRSALKLVPIENQFDKAPA